MADTLNPYAKFVTPGNPYAKFASQNQSAAELTLDDINADKGTWDSPLSGQQILAQRKQAAKADETLKAIESTAPEPGLAHLVWSLFGSPLEVAVIGGQSAWGERPLPTGVEALQEASLGVAPAGGRAAEGVAASVVNRAADMKAREAARVPWTPEQIGAAAEAMGAPKTTKALKVVEKRLNEAPTTAQAALDKMNAAAKAGDPLMLSDVHPGAKKLAGRMYRSGGAASENIGQALTERNAGAVGRTTGNINRDVASGSAYQAFEDMRQARSEAAEPLFKKAQAGGSIAPLETQLQDSFAQASKAEADAMRALQDARNKATVATGKQTQTGGNVYSTSAANEQARGAAKAVSDAEHALAVATRQKQETLEVLRQAQEDRTLNKPGAIWNPRIQEFLQDPDIKAGIRRGWEMERNTALGKGRPLNATEYAITGYEADGAPIVSKVPTFKLLQVAKEGVDAMLEEPRYRDELTGQLNKFGNSLKDKLTGYLAELDKANPDYAPARAQWSGDTANMRALKTGQTALKNKPEINAQLAAHMSESEKESAKLGLAQTLREAALDKGPLGSEFRTIAGTEYGATGNRARIAPFFDNKEDLDRFVQSAEREATKARTKSEVMGGSQSGERLAEDASPITPVDMAHAAISLGHGSPVGILHTGLNFAQKLWDRRDPELNAQIARILGNTGVHLERDPNGRIIVKLPGKTAP